MFKFIIISIICFYLLFKILGFLFRVLFSTLGSNAPKYSSFGGGFKQNGQRKPTDGNLNVDYIPNEKKNKKEYNGGEYVDYEEIK